MVSWVLQFSLVQFSRSGMSDSLPPHEPQHPRPLCPSPTPRVYSNSCPLSQWCYSTISSSVILFSSCLQSFLSKKHKTKQNKTKQNPLNQGLSNGSVLCIRWLKYWSFNFSIRPSNEYSGLISFRMDWMDLLAVQGTLKSLLQHHSSKASILRCSACFNSQLSKSIHDYWRNHSFDNTDPCWQSHISAF